MHLDPAPPGNTTARPQLGSCCVGYQPANRRGSSSSLSFQRCSSDDGQACQSSNPDSGKTRCVACHRSRIPPLAAELRRGCVGGVLPLSVFHSSSDFTTQRFSSKGCVAQTLTFEMCCAEANGVLAAPRLDESSLGCSVQSG